MPRVGKKKFPYSKAGKEAAKAESKKSGKPVKGRYNMATGTYTR